MTYIVFDGQGQSGLVEILEINKKTIDIEMKEIFPVSKREGLAIDLGQSLIKNDPFNIAVQKATELGVSNISPFSFSGFKI